VPLDYGQMLEIILPLLMLITCEQMSTIVICKFNI